MRYFLLAAMAAVATAGSADAYWWHGAGIGIGGLYRSLDFPTERRVPYFAARPPVYYSAPVPRTYGYSPFAYTPDTRTPDIVPASSGPVEIINPYVPSSSGSSAQPTRPAQKPEASPLSRPVSSRAEHEDEVELPSGLRVRSVGPQTIINPHVFSGHRAT